MKSTKGNEERTVMEVRGSELIGKKDVLDALDETAKAVTVGLDAKSNLFCLINATIDIAKCMVLKLPDARYNTDVGELISRESAVSTVWNALNKNDACKELRALPSITPIQELMEVSVIRDYWKAQCHAYEAEIKRIQPKRGKWIRVGSGSLYDHYECSECGKAPKWECMGDNRWKIAFTDFCPNCGAKMEVDNESN